MAHIDKVVRSYNFDGDMRCVDIFLRPDGSFGFQEYRRDVEDQRGWFALGVWSSRRFDTAFEAEAEARRVVEGLRVAGRDTA